jgi:tryptophanyl-tRNA synthetase
VLKFGAGMGLYSKKIYANGIHVSCYDESPNTQDLTQGFCAILDLSKPVHLWKHEWVFSLEVGEHIPMTFETVFLENLDKGNKKGIIFNLT